MHRRSACAALWAGGELIYEIAYSEAPDLAPYPSVADAFWLGAYVATAAGIVLVLRARLRRAFHPTMWLDAAIGATTIAALTATLAFDPVLVDTGGRLVGLNALRLEGGLILAVAAGSSW